LVFFQSFLGVFQSVFVIGKSLLLVGQLGLGDNDQVGVVFNVTFQVGNVGFQIGDGCSVGGLSFGVVFVIGTLVRFVLGGELFE